MKVREMIRQLEKFDPEARVYTSSYMGKGTDEVLACIAYVHNGDVIVQNENEFDVANEIDEMLHWYADNNYDEADAYREMIDRGYTPDLLDIYYDPEFKNHTMRDFCEEHGIEW